MRKRALPRHMKQLKLRVDFRGPMLRVPELEAWERRMRGKYKWCSRCRIARLAKGDLGHEHMDGLVITHREA